AGVLKAYGGASGLEAAGYIESIDVHPGRSAHGASTFAAAPFGSPGTPLGAGGGGLSVDGGGEYVAAGIVLVFRGGVEDFGEAEAAGGGVGVPIHLDVLLHEARGGVAAGADRQVALQGVERQRSGGGIRDLSAFEVEGANRRIGSQHG